jgi:ATP-dependent DNA helicase RecG
MEITSNITALPGIGELTAKQLSRVGISTIEDLLLYLPHRIEDRSHLVRIAQAPYDRDCVIEAEIKNIHSRKTRKGSLMIEARVDDGSGSIGAVWFNQRFVLSQLKTGQTIMLFGRKMLAPTIGNPFVVKKIVTAAEYVPIYPLAKGLFQGTVRRAIQKALTQAHSVPDVLTPTIIGKYGLPSRSQALLAVHQPKGLKELQSAKKLFGFEELLGLAIAIELSKRQRQKVVTDKIITDDNFLKDFVAALPFALTNGQRRAAWQIIQAMSAGYPTSQLLYGEVGSGKTIVSLLAALAMVRSGYRVLILVPTVTLASQQYAAVTKLVGDRAKTGLVTGSLKTALNEDIIIGTHALLNKADQLENIGLVIIDEQQRFGVRQRQQLSLHHPKAHLLMTTATPIPRSLAQTVLGNLTITYLEGKPEHQQQVVTRRFGAARRQSVLSEIRQRLQRGEAGYVICPVIEETDGYVLFEEDEKKSVTKEAKKLLKELPGAKLAALHGKMPSEEKTRILHQFLEGKINVLVATTVVEVGIDNPNATWMIIENAEMFGLSTLHQLRGRVGRGSKPAVCFACQSTLDDTATERLEIFERSQDGLALAEADLALRGPGEILGSEQSGLPSLKYADLRDKETVKEVFALAAKIVEEGVDNYPTLQPIIKDIDGLAAS